MEFVEIIKNKLLKKGGLTKKILFIDGLDKRAIEAALKHKKEGIIEPIILLEKHDLEIEKQLNTFVIEDYKNNAQRFIDKYVEKRRGKETVEDAKKVIFIPQFFAMLLLELNEVDGVIGGLMNPTSDILRSAFKIVGATKGIKTISSVMIMTKGEDWSIFTDISVIPEPTTQQLSDIAINANTFAKRLDLKTNTSFLSFSTDGSAKHPRATLVKEACELFNLSTTNKAIGEIQFDAAYNQEVRNQKYGRDSFTGKTNIFVFPSLEAGNIGYKIAQRMGGYNAIGPIITGIAKPINDLSRGANVKDIYNTALITAIQVK